MAARAREIPGDAATTPRTTYNNCGYNYTAFKRFLVIKGR